jgi:hypothetical protein
VIISNPSQIRLCLDLSKRASRFDNSMFLSTSKSQSSAAADDWLFAFPEVSKVYFQKRIGMLIERSRSGLSFSLLSPPLRPFLTERIERQDICVPATRGESSVKLNGDSFFCHSVSLFKSRIH